MKEKFKFTNWLRGTGDVPDEVDAAINGKRRKEDGRLEEVFIWITLKSTKRSSVTFRHYIDRSLNVEAIKYYTDTRKMMQEIKAYIDNLEK